MLFKIIQEAIYMNLFIHALYVTLLRRSKSQNVRNLKTY